MEFVSKNRSNLKNTMISEVLIPIFAFLGLTALGLQFNWSPSGITDATDLMWITVSFLIGKLVGYLILAPSLCLLDGKTVILLGSISLAVSWVANGFSRTRNAVIMGKLVGGVADTVIYGALLMYLVEKSHGLLGKFLIGLQPFLLVIGSMVQKTLEFHTSYTTACLLSAVSLLVIFAMLILTLHSEPDRIVDDEPVQDRGKVMVQLIVRCGVLSMYLLLASGPVMETYIYDKLDTISSLFQSVMHLVIQIMSLEIAVIKIEEFYRIYLRFACCLGMVCSTTVAALYIWTSPFVFLISATMLAVSVNVGLQTVRSIKNKFYAPNLRKVKIGISEICTCGALLAASKVFIFCANEYGFNLSSLVFLMVCVILLNVLCLQMVIANKKNMINRYTPCTTKDASVALIPPI